MIAYEIKQHRIQCDIKLNIQAAVKWKTMPFQASIVMLKPLVLFGGFPVSESALPLHMN